MNDQRFDGLPSVPREDRTPVERASNMAREAGRSIVSEFGAALDRRDRLRIIAIFKRTLIPPGRPGRIPCGRITEAYQDCKAGLHGLALYRKHIPGLDKMNQYKRKYEVRRLMETIRTRERRAARNRPSNPDNGSPERG